MIKKGEDFLTKLKLNNLVYDKDTTSCNNNVYYSFGKNGCSDGNYVSITHDSYNDEIYIVTVVKKFNPKEIFSCSKDKLESMINIAINKIGE